MWINIDAVPLRVRMKQNALIDHKLMDFFNDEFKSILKTCWVLLEHVLEIARMFLNSKGKKLHNAYNSLWSSSHISLIKIYFHRENMYIIANFNTQWSEFFFNKKKAEAFHGYDGNLLSWIKALYFKLREMFEWRKII
jgi:hypothetical protein